MVMGALSVHVVLFRPTHGNHMDESRNKIIDVLVSGGSNDLSINDDSLRQEKDLSRSPPAMHA